MGCFYWCGTMVSCNTGSCVQSHNHLPVIVKFSKFSKLHNAQNQVREWFKRKGPKFRFYKFLIICFGMFRCHTRETNIAGFFWETFKLSSLQSSCSFDVHDSFGIGKSRHANVFQANLIVTLVDLFGIGWAAKNEHQLDNRSTMSQTRSPVCFIVL